MKHNYTFTLRRTFSAVLLLLFSTFLWADGFESGDICYSINADGTSVTVARYRTKVYSGDVVIPFTVAHECKTYGVTGIGDGVFAKCTSLTSISLPGSLTSIGDAAFARCTSLTSISLPNGLTRIGDTAFFGCSSLTSIFFNDGLKRIERFAFIGCSSLASISLPDGLKSMGDGAFGGCTTLTSISLPGSFAYIGNFAFEACSSLTTVTCRAEYVSECGTNVFKETPTEKVTLYVPSHALSRYREADQWKDFGTIRPLKVD